LVSPGAATEGVTPMFSWKKTGDLHRLSVLQYHPYLFFSYKIVDIFCSSLSLLFISLGITPRGCQPDPFLHVRRRSSTILCKFSHKFFSFGCHPLEGVTRGGPPSDANKKMNSRYDLLSVRTTTKNCW